MLVLVLAMASASMRKVRARAGAARCLLRLDPPVAFGACATSTALARAKREEVSSSQATQLLECLMSAGLSDAEKTEAIEICMTVPWEGHDGDEVLSFLTLTDKEQEPFVKPDGRGKSRRPQQDIMNIVDYYTEEDYEILFGDHGTALLTQVIMHRPLRMNLVNPNEFGIKQLHTMLRQVSKEYRTVSIEQTKVLLEAFKIDYRRRARHFRETFKDAHYCTLLPASPAEFKVKAPDLYARAYGERTPIKCKLDMTELKMLDAGSKCRLATSSIVKVPGPSVGCMAPGGDGVAQQMQQMQSMLMQSFMLMLNQGQEQNKSHKQETHEQTRNT